MPGAGPTAGLPDTTVRAGVRGEVLGCASKVALPTAGRHPGDGGGTGQRATASPCVGAALRRERAAQRPQDFSHPARSPGLLRSPFATQGRSHKGPRRHEKGDLGSPFSFQPAINEPGLQPRPGRPSGGYRSAAHHRRPIPKPAVALPTAGRHPGDGGGTGQRATASPCVGAALRRERAAQRPQDFSHPARSPGLLRSPFATQGRSHKGPRRHEKGDLGSPFSFQPAINEPGLQPRPGRPSGGYRPAAHHRRPVPKPACRCPFP